MRPTWKIERDLASGEVAVTTGEKMGFPLPQGGSIEVDHVAVARVAAARPDGAAVEGDTKIRVRAPVIGEIEVATTRRVSQTGMTLSGRVTMDGHVIFEKRWQR